MIKTIVGILAVLVTAGVAYLILTHTNSGKDKMAASIAQDICGSVTPGMRMQQVSDVATRKQGWFHAYAPDGARIGADGWYLNCRCNVLFKNGVVASVSQPVCID